MTKIFLDGKKIFALLIEMSGKAVSEGMSRNRRSPSKKLQMALDVVGTGRL